MSEKLTTADVNQLYQHFERSAFRLETLPQYVVEPEQRSFEKFLSGEEPDVVDVPGYQEWLGWVVQATGAGKQIERVRIFSDTPTAYQRWEARIGRHNEAVGERIRYLQYSKALSVGIPVTAGDWWLLDSVRVIFLRFDEHGRPLGGELDEDPDRVVACLRWQNLAFKASSRLQDTPALRA